VAQIIERTGEMGFDKEGCEYRKYSLKWEILE
jgi:hypothetical protein